MSSHAEIDPFLLDDPRLDASGYTAELHARRTDEQLARSLAALAALRMSIDTLPKPIRSRLASVGLEPDDGRDADIIPFRTRRPTQDGDIDIAA